MRRNQEGVQPAMPTQPVYKDASNPANFGRPRQNMTGPIVAPGVTDPRALAYAAGATARKNPGARYAAPVAGGPGPSIPRLNAEVMPGMTMADQAAVQRAQAEGAQHQG